MASYDEVRNICLALRSGEAGTGVSAVPDAFKYSTSPGPGAGVCAGAGAAKGAGAAAGTGAAEGVLSAIAAAEISGEAKRLRVAYQGMPGAYSEGAALIAYPACEPSPHALFENVFEVSHRRRPRRRPNDPTENTNQNAFTKF